MTVIFDREDLPFPGSLPEFQRLFPTDAACAAYPIRAVGSTLTVVLMGENRISMELTEMYDGRY